MKKLLFLLIAALTLSTLTYASFPVTEGTLCIVEDSTILADSNNTSTEVPGGSVDWDLFWWCLFLGELGVHRYMMGDIWQGIVQTLTLGCLGVWSLIDLIRIANGTLSR